MLFDIVKENNSKTISFIGMAKNVGKTTALNILLKECFHNKFNVGIASIGRDGEDIDAITGMKKPKIWAARDTIIAAAKEAIIRSNISMEILEDTGFTSSLGQIYVVKVKRAGYAEIATTPSINKMKQIIKIMNRFGAELVLVDGALDRASSAAPEMTDSTILSTGASLHPNLETVVLKTTARVQQLTIPPLKKDKKLLSPVSINNILNASTSLIFGKDEEAVTPMDKISFDYEKQLLNFIKKQQIHAIYIKGAVVENLLNFFIANRRQLQNTPLIIDRGTNVLVDYRCWSKYLLAHGYIRTINPINLLGITCNPTSHRGESFPVELFVDELAKNNRGIMVVDLYTKYYQKY